MQFITAVRFSGGTSHKHITDVRWLNGETGKAMTVTTANMIKHIEGGNTVHVGGDDKPSTVGVVEGRHLRSYADKEWDNNLTSLPRF